MQNDNWLRRLIKPSNAPCSEINLNCARTRIDRADHEKSLKNMFEIIPSTCLVRILFWHEFPQYDLLKSIAFRLYRPCTVFLCGRSTFPGAEPPAGPPKFANMLAVNVFIEILLMHPNFGATFERIFPELLVSTIQRALI